MVDEYLKRYANQIAEANSQGNFNTPEIIANSLRLSRVATPKDFADFKEAFKDYDHGLGSWKKWGGGNKMGSGGAAVNAARRARAEARRSAPDANVNKYTNKNLADRLGLTALSNFVDSHLNDTQGKFMPSNPSFGFSQKTLNEAGARGADPSFAGDIGASVYGGDMTGSTPSIGSYGSSFSNFTGGLPSVDAGSFLGDTSLSNLSSFSPGSFLSSFINGLQDNSFQIASHDRPLSRYPAANADDRWPGMSTDDIKRLVHPSLDPLMHIRDLPFGMQV
jgi:hypothetical protein